MFHCTCTRIHAKHFTYLCWNDQVSSSALVSLRVRATVLSWSLQANQPSPSTSEGLPNSPSPAKKIKKEIIKRNRWRWSLRATVKQKSAGQWRTELCSPYQYHSGCGAHHPASTTVIPEIKIMSGLRLWLHPGESSGEREDCHVFPRWDCSFHEIRPSRTRIQTACTHTHPPQRCGRQSSVGDIWNHTHRHTH